MEDFGEDAVEEVVTLLQDSATDHEYLSASSDDRST